MKFHILLVLTLFLTACSESDIPQTSNSKDNISKRQLDANKIKLGQQKFTENCAQCHGQHAEATPDWKKTGADGKYPPPPLNGTGHAWHHPQRVLHNVIKRGTIKIGGSMPAWKDKLTDNDIDNIIEWIKSIWPDEVYQAWERRNKSS